MKKSIRMLALAGSLAVLAVPHSRSQISDIGLILCGGVDDAQKLMNGYLTPLANSLGANLNAGWYNTAKTHDLFGFHLNITVSAAFAPDADKIYDLSALDLTASPAENEAPTFSGETGLGPNLDYSFMDYDHPGGTGLKFVPSPMLNAGFGLPKGFEIQGRFMPELSYEGLSTGLWGLGLKHDLKQWIPFVKRVPAMQLAVHYAYTDLKMKAELSSITPATLGIVDNTNNVDWDGQNLDMNTTAHTASLLVGANIPVVAFYGGVGISVTKTLLEINGNFPVPEFDPLDPDFGTVTDESVEQGQLKDIEIRNTDGSTTRPRLNAGIRFKFAVITLHFDYTYANYSVATAGLGISFR